MKTNTPIARTTSPNTVAARLRTTCAVKLLALLLMALPAAVQAQFIFTTNPDGSLNIYKYTGSGGAVTIPDTTNGLPITTIGEDAFWLCTSLTSVTISSSVTSIGQDAFASCSRLTSVTIPISVINLGNDAFAGCTSLTSVTIPGSVTSFGLEVFAECTSLTNVTMGANLTSIGAEAFEYCTNLTGVYFLCNAPSPTNNTSVFEWDNKATAYYMAGTTGWGTNYDGIPTALWTVPVAPPPAVGILTYSNQPLLFFPAPPPGPNYVLQMTTNLASTNWVTVNNGIPISGMQLTNAPANAFFRLQ